MLPGLCRGPREPRRVGRSVQLSVRPCAHSQARFQDRCSKPLCKQQLAAAKPHLHLRLSCKRHEEPLLCFVRSRFLLVCAGCDVRAHRGTRAAKQLQGACASAGHQPAQPCSNWCLSPYQIPLGPKQEVNAKLHSLVKMWSTTQNCRHQGRSKIEQVEGWATIEYAV